MHRSVHVAFVLACACALLAFEAPTLAAQQATTPDQTASVLQRMRADLAARRYATVITQANALLESARVISTPQRIELWQLLAAAYYPAATRAQQPDSARLPLSALIRMAPDIIIAREFSWPGLDELTERTRAASFAVVTRPRAGYVLSTTDTAYLDVVASRRTRFRLTSVDATGRTVVHDSTSYLLGTSLQLRTHDASGPIFTDGTHHLYIWAYDLDSGDSVRIAHRVRALRSDAPAPIAVADAPAPVALPEPNSEPTSERPSVATRRSSSMLWGGLALAAATAVLAQEARPDDGLRAAFRVDARAFVVGATMAGAAIANFFTSRPSRPPPARPEIVIPQPQPPPIDRYRVRLVVDPPER